MTGLNEHDHFGCHSKMWTVTAFNWTLENPDYRYKILVGSKIEEPAKEVESTQELESIQAPDLDGAIAAAHRLLDKHAERVGEFALEIHLVSPQLPHPDQERLGIRDYKLTPEARKQARAIGLRGELEQRVGRMVRHAAPYEHKVANLRYRGIIMKVEDDTVSWIDLVVRPRRRRRKTK
jgi:hypothetical protein